MRVCIDIHVYIYIYMCAHIIYTQITSYIYIYIHTYILYRERCVRIKHIQAVEAHKTHNDFDDHHY